jgi:EAL and modified HD-GYP domain-containing signal transduction protein
LSQRASSENTASNPLPAEVDTAFLARQPIFDAGRQVVGYALLFRSGTANVYLHRDGDAATRLLLKHLEHHFDFDALVGGKLAFINTTAQALIEQTYQVLPSAQTVLKLDGDIKVDDALIDACRALKKEGYRLALDASSAACASDALVDTAAYLCVNYEDTPPDRRLQLEQQFASRRDFLLAAKIETHEQFDQAKEAGYAFFQGFFFCRPKVITYKQVPPSKTNLLRFMQQVNQPDLDLDGLEKIIRQEISLSLKLLQYGHL